MSKITHNGYLNKALRSLKANPGTLFIHGMSLSANDEHILRAIEKGKFKKVFIGIHGNPDTERNQAIAARAEMLTHNNGRLEVQFYDSTSAEVWGTA
jgi:predicted phosphodiesterase